MSTETVSTEFADLKTSLPFKRMTTPQQNWLIEYLKTGSIHAATRAAYPDAKDSSQMTMAYQIPKTNAVRECLDWYRFRDAETSRQSLIEIVRKQLDAAEPGSVSAQRLCSQLQSLTVGHQPPAQESAPEPAEPSQALVSKIGDIVLVNGEQCRVTAVDENGKPTDGEPL